MALPVPPLPRKPELDGLDKIAWDLIEELNHELQAVPGKDTGS
jgi:hypothetical protein